MTFKGGGWCCGTGNKDVVDAATAAASAAAAAAAATHDGDDKIHQLILYLCSIKCIAVDNSCLDKSQYLTIVLVLILR